MSPIAARLRQRSVLIPSCGCRIWQGCINPRTGYGQIRINGKLESTHRAAFREFVGPIPDGHHVLHRCDTRSCIAEDHLFVGTNLDNIMDSVAKGRRKGITRRRPKGLLYRVPPGAHDIKLKVPRSEWPAVLTRIAAGETQAKIAASYGVDQSTISNIKKRCIRAGLSGF